MSRHLMVLWLIGLVVLVGGGSFAFFKLRASAASGKGGSKREETRKVQKEEKKKLQQKRKEELKEKKEEPAPKQDPAEARRVRRQAMETRAKAAAESAFIYGMFEGDAVDYRADNTAERENKAAIFERKLVELHPTLSKELGARPNAQKHWWGADLTVESESTFTIALPLRMAGPGGTLDIRVILPAKYPSVAVHLRLMSTTVSAAALEHLRTWTAAQLPRLQGKPHIVELLDALFAGAERRLTEFDVKDWTEEQQRQLEDALKSIGEHVQMDQRYDAVAAQVEGKTRYQCLARGRFLKAKLLRQAQEQVEDKVEEFEAVDEDWGQGAKSKGKGARRAAREEAAMLGLSSYASDGDDGSDDEEEDVTESEEEEEQDEDTAQDLGVTNIYPGTGDAEVDGVGQHIGTQVLVQGMTWGGCSVAQLAQVRVLAGSCSNAPMPRVCSRLFLCLPPGARASHKASADTKQALTQSKHPTQCRCGYWSLVRAATTTRRPSSRATRCSFSLRAALYTRPMPRVPVPAWAAC